MNNKNILAIIGVLQLVVFSCMANTSTSNKTYAVSSWSGAWTFTGFQVGPSSGEYYHLLSTSVENQCAIVKETTSGTVTWSKLYSASQCAGLTIDSTETYVYFANNEVSEFGINQVSCSTGDTNNYYTSSLMNISGGINDIDAKRAPGYVMFSGNIINATSGDTCSGFWDVSGTSFKHVCTSNYDYLGSFSIPDGACMSHKKSPSGEIWASCYNVSDLSVIWQRGYNMSGSAGSDSYANGRMDTDDNNIYSAYDLATPEGIYLFTLYIPDGTFVGALYNRNSTKSLKIGSVYATGSSVVYISAYSSTEAYAELIKFDYSGGGYTIYEQTGVNLRFQFLDTAQSNCWIGLVDTEYIHLSQLSTMSEVTGLTVVERASTGLDIISTLNRSETTGTLSAIDGTFDTTTTNIGSTFNGTITSNPGGTSTSLIPVVTNTTTNTTTSNNTTTTTTNNNNSDDDSLSTLAIVLISIGAVVLIVIVVTVVLCVMKCRKKSRNTRSELSIVETPADESNALKEENKI